MNIQNRISLLKDLRQKTVQNLVKYRHENNLTFQNLVDQSGMSSRQYFFNIEKNINLPTLKFLLTFEKNIGKNFIPSENKKRKPGQMIPTKETQKYEI